MNPSLHLLVSVDDQTLNVFRGDLRIREFKVSTAANGTGFENDSYRTPTGRFRVCERIGIDQPVGTIFKGRIPVGVWQAGESPDDDLILTRILRIDGLDPENANTFERCIYIHGTNREDLIGQPVSHGCIRLGNENMIELFEMVSEGDRVDILPSRGEPQRLA